MTVRVSRLANGMTVATDRMPEVETAAVGVWVAAGARNERPEINGIAHLLEHMAFKGTRRRSALAIAEEIEAVGGHLNAYTSRESTAYYVRILKDDLRLAVDLLADILQHSVFDETELRRERDVVLQEIGQANDTPDDIVFDHFQAAAFPEQPLGRPVLGTTESVGALPRAALFDYMAAHYHGPRMVLAAAGHVDHDALLTLAEEAFSELPATADGGPVRARYAGGAHVESRELEQVHVLFGFRGVSFTDPEHDALAVLSTLFGGGMSSRLFREVREKRGLVYSIYSFHTSYADDGLFGIYAGSGPERVAELVPVICDEIGKLARAVDEEEVARARIQLKAGHAMARESTSSRCEQLAQQIHAFGRPLSTDEIIARIEAVDGSAVTALARRLAASRLTYAAMGPAKGIPTYDAVRARLQ